MGRAPRGPLGSGARSTAARFPRPLDRRACAPGPAVAYQLLFPEIDYMRVDKPRGMNITVVTTAKTDEESRRLLQLLGFPFRQG